MSTRLCGKTLIDGGVIAWVRWMRDRHAGIENPHRRSLPGGKASPYKRLIGGRVVRRRLSEQEE